jgi:nitrogen fixation protein FixH
MTDTAERSGFTLKGWHVLAGMIGFFATIIAVNIVFITLAVRSFPGEETRRSYVQGLAYNDVLEERRAQEALGWSASVNLTQTRVMVEVRDAGAEPVDGLRLSGHLRHPADGALDRALTFTQVREGVYAAGVSDLGPGRWRLDAQAAGDTPFAVEAELNWRP